MESDHRGDTGARELQDFRSEFYASLTRWGDALFELSDAVLFAPGPVGSVPALSLEAVFRRSHGSLYRALANGRIDEDRLRQMLVCHRPRDWPLVFAVDASTFARCDAETSPERGFYYSASRHSAGQPIVAGWSYQWICQLSFAFDSWTAPLDVFRLRPDQDTTTTIIEQVRSLVGHLPGDRAVPLFVFDAGYDPIALGHGLIDSRSRCSRASVMTVSSTPIHRHGQAGRHQPVDDRRVMVNGTSAQRTRAGHRPMMNSLRTTFVMARCLSAPGMTCTRVSSDGDAGPETDTRRSSR